MKSYEEKRGRDGEGEIKGWLNWEKKRKGVTWKKREGEGVQNGGRKEILWLQNGTEGNTCGFKCLGHYKRINLDLTPKYSAVEKR